MKKMYLLLPVIYLSVNAFAQSVSPATTNATGGWFNNSVSNFALDWSVAEMTLVNTLQSPGNGNVYVLTNGLLQPLTVAKKSGGGKKPTARFTTGEVLVFPNPAVDYLAIRVRTEETGTIRMKLYNAIGQLVFTKTIQKETKELTERINTATLATGTYMLTLDLETSPVLETKQAVYSIIKVDHTRQPLF